MEHAATCAYTGGGGSARGSLWISWTSGPMCSCSEMADVREPMQSFPVARASAHQLPYEPRKSGRPYDPLLYRFGVCCSGRICDSMAPSYRDRLDNECIHPWANMARP